MARYRKVEVQKLDPNMRVEGVQPGALVWRSPKERPFQIAGLAWFAQDGEYRRMPVRPVLAIPQSVDDLANCTAGVQVRFRSNSPRVAVRVELLAPPNMDHMPATGQCGFDCYVGPVGTMLYCRTARLTLSNANYEALLYEAPGREMQQFTLNFPLYQGVKRVQIGLATGARIAPPERYESNRRVVVYGTSITQGGCASRPGMCYTNVLSRRVNREFINLGFSGSGRGEPEVAEVIAGIERPGLLALDYEANCQTTERYMQTLPQFIRILRRAHATTPLLVISRVRYARELHEPAETRQRLARLAFARGLVARLRRAGDRNLHFTDGGRLLGPDFHECAVDGVHPTDLGFTRMADGLEGVFRRFMR